MLRTRFQLRRAPLRSRGRRGVVVWRAWFWDPLNVQLKHRDNSVVSKDWSLFGEGRSSRSSSYGAYNCDVTERTAERDPWTAPHRPLSVKRIERRCINGK